MNGKSSCSSVALSDMNRFEHLVEHLLRVRVLAVDLVDDDDGLGAGFERLAQHEAGLRLRTVGGVHHQQHAVDHVHDALDLAAEIGVAGRVHDVDVVVLVFERGVLGADGDALLLLEVHRVHEAFLLGFVLVGAEGAGLFEQAIHERGLAVVHVRDDRDIANVLHRKCRLFAVEGAALPGSGCGPSGALCHEATRLQARRFGGCRAIHRAAGPRSGGTGQRGSLLATSSGHGQLARHRRGGVQDSLNGARRATRSEHRATRRKVNRRAGCQSPVGLRPPTRRNREEERRYYSAKARLAARSFSAVVIGSRLNFSCSTWSTFGETKAGSVGPNRMLRMPR